jgi:glycosyltransferase involved in cell wall biosynthesis
MGACWRSLAARPNIELLVTVQPPQATETVAFTADSMAGVPVRYISLENLDVELPKVASEFKPDIVVLCGWATSAFRKLTSHPTLRDVHFVMAMDTPLRGTLRQRVGGIVRGAYFSRIDRVLVAGERTFRLARLLGFPEYKIRRGMYGVDHAGFSAAAVERAGKPWPRRFIFMGRYHHDKAIDTLVQGYDLYASSVSDPWEMWTCGRGPLAHLLAGRERVIDLGFVQPKHQPERFANAGCFVLPSRYEPWGAVIAEACSSGLPVICSEACGASVDLVHHLYNGFRVATDSPEHLAAGFRWIHEQREERLRLMGQRSQAFAEPYGCEIWSDLLVHIMDELTPASK